MNLEQLREHPFFPFLAFRENDLEFLLLEMFWAEFFRDCLEKPEHVKDWESLFPAERDGVPILVVANASRNRAVRIHLRLNAGDKPLFPPGAPQMHGEYFLPLDLWLDEVRDSTGTTAYPSVVISTDMSLSALAMTRKVLNQFCLEEDPQGPTRAWIDQYYEALDANGYPGK
ncbi:hypothetical protein A176_006398 [Myxococcus hansupus]|uniref:Uncharacterized protein n=1 Tax=Pseudomyxococcus hansupus TaxID=1297742 RepID=A0A0H4X1G2_9BACT|nr:hypothetical protein [Myxococcus hansupus]AKQ69486.1 hypothetical protein A176_006398 [Myxococcus hansupus]